MSDKSKDAEKSKESDNDPNIGYKLAAILFLVFSLFFIGYSIAALVYFNRIRKNECEKISESDASTMYYVSVFVLIGAIIFLIIGLFLGFFGFFDGKTKIDSL